MPATVVLKWDESFSEDGIDLIATIDGAETESDVIVAIGEQMPPTIGGFQLSRLESADAVPGHPGLWTAKIRYAINKRKLDLGAGENEFSFNSEKRTTKRTISYESYCYDSTGEIEVSDALLIGYKPGAGTVEGVDEPDDLNAFRWRVAVPFSLAAESWRRSVGSLRNSVCEAGFFGYDAESVLFNDITGNVSADGLYTFDMSFTQVEHQEDVVVGGIEIGTLKAFWNLDICGVAILPTTIGDKKYMLPQVFRVKKHRTKLIKDWSLIYSVLGMS